MATVWTLSLTRGGAGRLVEDAIRAREEGATCTFDAPTPFLGGTSFLAVLLFQPQSIYSAGSGKPSRTFAPLHQVCTGISEKVQTKMPAISERILELDIDLERYVQIRIVVCTICTGNGEPPRGGNPGPGACENRGGANVLEVPGYLRLIGEYGAVWGYSRCNIKCKRGANGCKGVTRTISPVNPGGQERPGTYLVGWGSTPVGETAANRIRTISLTPAEHLHDHHPARPGTHRREPPLLPHFLRLPAAPAPGSGSRTPRVAPTGAPVPAPWPVASPSGGRGR